jgi:hypothetical protein
VALRCLCVHTWASDSFSVTIFPHCLTFLIVGDLYCYLYSTSDITYENKGLIVRLNLFSNSEFNGRLSRVSNFVVTNVTNPGCELETMFWTNFIVLWNKKLSYKMHVTDIPAWFSMQIGTVCIHDLLLHAGSNFLGKRVMYGRTYSDVQLP